MIRYIKATTKPEWFVTPVRLLIDGEVEDWNSYSRDLKDGWAATVYPSYNPRSEQISWVVTISKGEENRKLESFEVSYEAQDFVDNEVEEYFL